MQLVISVRDQVKITDTNFIAIYNEWDIWLQCLICDGGPSIYLWVHLKPGFPLGECVRAILAETRIQQRDWLSKTFADSPANHFAKFLFLL